jgi:transposase-like protein
MPKVVKNKAEREASGELFELDEIARAGAQRMLMAALEMEAADYVERHRHERDEEGRALVVHNGRAKERNIGKGWQRPVREWTAALHQFTIVFADRFTAETN